MPMFLSVPPPVAWLEVIVTYPVATGSLAPLSAAMVVVIPFTANVNANAKAPTPGPPAVALNGEV